MRTYTAVMGSLATLSILLFIIFAVAGNAGLGLSAAASQTSDPLDYGVLTNEVQQSVSLPDVVQQTVSII